MYIEIFSAVEIRTFRKKAYCIIYFGDAYIVLVVYFQIK